MAIAKMLADVHEDFIQVCPLCGRKNRIVVHGLWVLGKEIKQHPDMGYSFCNCRSIFYTNNVNVTNPASYLPNENGIITLPDPYFAWPDPYQFLGWEVRRYQILFDLEDLCEEYKRNGYKIIYAERDFDVNSKTPQCFHIKVEKNV